MLPKEILTDTVEHLHAKHETHVNLIYKVTLLSICVAFVSLPFIQVSITIQSPAVIRPSTDKTTLHALVNGVVSKSFVTENTLVKRFDTLLILESKLLTDREIYLNDRAIDLTDCLNDIDALTQYLQRHGQTLPPNLKTKYYAQILSDFGQKQINILMYLRKVKIEYDRSSKLHDEHVIADAEFEHNDFELNKARQELQYLKTTQVSQLRTDELNYSKEARDIQFQKSQLAKEKEAYIIKAPCSGTISNSGGIYSGSTISASEPLVEISPDTDLVTEAYVSPSDIGFLRKQMAVNFQINAFNYNEWGMVAGTVLEISDDVVLIGERPVFKVRCALSKNYLMLQNGYKGFLKKGMSASARFVVTQRTIWQLLFDKVDDWINPHLNPVKR